MQTLATNTESTTTPTQKRIGKNKHSLIQLPSTSSPSITLLTKSIDEIWLNAVNHIKVTVNRNSKESNTSKTASIIASASKVQMNLTQVIERSIYKKLFDSCNATQRTIMTACSENIGTGSFLTVIPTQFETTYRMKNEQFCLAIRHRLGMLPYDELLHEECLVCLRRNIHRPSFQADPDHLHSCITQTGSSVSRRHHRLVHQLATLAKSVGFHTTHEPSFPSILTTTVDPTASDQPVYTTVKNKDRGDLLLIRGNQVLLIDVSVTRPTSTMNLSNNKDDVTIQAGVASSIVEKRKHDHYDEECKKHGWKLIPFVLETYGGLGKEATKLLLDMAESADSALAFIQHARNVLSVALQCGNADISSLGTTQFLYNKHSTAINHSSHHHHHHHSSHSHSPLSFNITSTPSSSLVEVFN
jgi:hypothetical protein